MTELDEISQLKAQIQGMTSTIEASNKKFSTFVENIVDKLNPIHPIAGMVDETVCMGLIDELIARESRLQSEIKKIEQQSEKKEYLLREENRDLNTKITQLLKEVDELRKDNENQASKIEDLKTAIKEVKQAQVTIFNKKDDFKTFKQVINNIKTMVKGLYAKEK